MAGTLQRPRTVMDPVGESVAKVYAQAALELAPDIAQAASLLEELLAVVGMLDRQAEFEAMLASPGTSARQRQETVGRVFAGRVSPTLESLLGVLAGHGRMTLLRRVAAAMQDLLKKRRGQMDVQVATAVPLTAPQRETITRALQQAIGAEPVLHTSVDPALLGGVVLHVGDRLIDASLANKLRQIGRELAQKLGRQVAGLAKTEVTD